jgi:hypothetical protein
MYCLVMNKLWLTYFMCNKGGPSIFMYFIFKVVQSIPLFPLHFALNRQTHIYPTTKNRH